MKLKFKESKTLKGSMHYNDNLVVHPGGIYDFTKEEAARAMKDFPNNFEIADGKEAAKQEHKAVVDADTEDKKIGETTGNRATRRK